MSNTFLRVSQKETSNKKENPFCILKKSEYSWKQWTTSKTFSHALYLIILNQNFIINHNIMTKMLLFTLVLETMKKGYFQTSTVSSNGKKYTNFFLSSVPALVFLVPILLWLNSNIFFTRLGHAKTALFVFISSSETIQF